MTSGLNILKKHFRLSFIEISWPVQNWKIKKIHIFKFYFPLQKCQKVFKFSIHLKQTNFKAKVTGSFKTLNKHKKMWKVNKQWKFDLSNNCMIKQFLSQIYFRRRNHSSRSSSSLLLLMLLMGKSFYFLSIFSNSRLFFSQILSENRYLIFSMYFRLFQRGKKPISQFGPIRNCLPDKNDIVIR